MTATRKIAATLGTVVIATAALAAGTALASGEAPPAVWAESSFAFARPLSDPGWHSERAEGLLGLWTCLDCGGRRGSILSSWALYLAASAALGGDGEASIGYSMEAISASGPDGRPCMFSLGWATVDRAPWSGIRFSIAGNWSSARFTGVQWSAGLNHAPAVCGLQIGLVNVAGSVSGAQIGLVNVSSSAGAVQIGLVNLRPRGA